jgi:acyl carrier protein
LNLQQTAEQRTEANNEYLLGLWAEILATENVSTDSDFFQLGGDSLQMMTMLFRVSQDLGVELSPGAVFDAPTPAELAVLLSNLQAGELEDDVNNGII